MEQTVYPEIKFYTFICFIGGVTPIELKCETTTSSIKVSWIQPDPLGKVKQYIVTRNETESTDVTKQTPDAFYTFDNLKLYTPYHITVATENEKTTDSKGGGIGDAATIDCQTDPKGKPTA